MGSPTRKTEAKRKSKHAGLARRRKNHSAKYGSTPKQLPLDKPNSNEKALKQAQ